jgi:hypothetical protein
LFSSCFWYRAGKASGRVSPASWLAEVGLWPVGIALQCTVRPFILKRLGSLQICLYHDIFKNPRVFDEKRLSAKRKTGNGRMVVVDDLLQLRIKILFRNISPSNKIKIPLYSFTFEIIFTIFLNTDTRRCLVEPWSSFMSNVIGSIWRNLKKRKKMY